MDAQFTITKLLIHFRSKDHLQIVYKSIDCYRFFDYRQDRCEIVLGARVDHEQRFLRLDLFANLLDLGKSDCNIDRIMRLSSAGAEKQRCSTDPSRVNLPDASGLYGITPIFSSRQSGSISRSSSR